MLDFSIKAKVIISIAITKKTAIFICKDALYKFCCTTLTQIVPHYEKHKTRQQCQFSAIA